MKRATSAVRRTDVREKRSMFTERCISSSVGMEQVIDHGCVARGVRACGTRRRMVRSTRNGTHGHLFLLKTKKKKKKETSRIRETLRRAKTAGNVTDLLNKQSRHIPVSCRVFRSRYLTFP